jgi:glycine/D-amino acid oxidase-like deaminating enzyme
VTENLGGPIWQRPAAPSPGAPPRRVDVAVVGGGITGVALARRLVRDGASVCLLERDHLGAGATGRNAGFLLTGVAANYAVATATYGRARAAEIWQFTIDNHRLLAEALVGAEVGYARHGSWVLPSSTDEREQLLASAALLREDGLPGQWHDDAPESGGGPGGGLLTPTDGEVDPGQALAALVAPVPPGVVFEGVEVVGIDASAGEARVYIEGAEVAAARVVLAINGYTQRLLPGLPVRAVRAQMLATSPAPRTITERPVYSDFGYRYWRQLGDGRVLLGGFRNTAFEAEVGDDDTPTTALQARLDHHLESLSPGAQVTHRWAGTMGFTPDELPLVGPVPGRSNVFVCGGYSGHGLGFALHAAEVLVDSWSGRSIPTWLDPARFGA